MVYAPICLCLPWFLSSVLYSFLSIGILLPWLGLFLGILFFLLLYQMGFSPWFLFLMFHCWYTKMPSISEYWFCITLFCQIHLLGRGVFGGVYRIFFVHYHVIGKQWQFASSFPTSLLLFLFLVLSLWLELPILCWIEAVKLDTLVLFLISPGKL